MPNISEKSVSHISLSRAGTVTIIFFLADGKSIEGSWRSDPAMPQFAIYCTFVETALRPFLQPTHVSEKRGA
jgi:hypothetical protein